MGAHFSKKEIEKIQSIISDYNNISCFNLTLKLCRIQYNRYSYENFDESNLIPTNRHPLRNLGQNSLFFVSCRKSEEINILFGFYMNYFKINKLEEILSLIVLSFQEISEIVEKLKNLKNCSISPKFPYFYLREYTFFAHGYLIFKISVERFVEKFLIFIEYDFESKSVFFILNKVIDEVFFSATAPNRFDSIVELIDLINSENPDNLDSLFQKLNEKFKKDC